MTTLLTGLGRAEMIIVRGQPITQGSKRAFAIRRKGTNGQPVYTGKVAMIDDANADHRERNRTWRSLVQEAAQAALEDRPPIEGAVALRATFTLPRPKSHFGTGRNALVLKPSAPPYPAGKPDEEKLGRAVKDALKDAGVYRDDAQITDSHVCKRYAAAHWQGDGTAGLERLPDPTILCGVRDADVLSVPGVVVRVWQML